jgi:DNA topoisomerase II
MVLFDEKGCLRRYESVNVMLREFFHVRSQLYKKRKEYMEGMLGAESLKLDNIARFIMEKIEGKIKVENLKKADICKMLKERKYDADPVSKWKAKIIKEQGYQGDDPALSQAAPEDEDDVSSDKHDYDYLLSMPIWNLTMEKKDEILKQQKNKADELGRLKAKTPNQLWLDDLEEFKAELHKHEQKEKEEDAVAQLKAFKAGVASKGGASRKGADKTSKLEYMPSEDGELIRAEIDKELEAKSKKDAASKENKLIKKEENKEPSIVDIISKSHELNDTEINDILSKINNPAAKAAKKEPAVKKEKAVAAPKLDSDGNPIEPKKRTLKAEPSSKTNLRKGAEGQTLDKFFKKKNKGTDSSNEDDDDVESISSTSFSPPAEKRVIARERKPVKYAGMDLDDDESTKDSKASADSENSSKKKKKKHESDSDEIFEVKSDEDEEDDFKPAKNKKAKTDEEKDTPPKTKKSPPAKKDTKRIVDDDDEDTENKPPEKKIASIFMTKKPSAAKEKAAAAPKEKSATAAKEKSAPAAKEKPAAAAKKKAKYSDSEESECFMVEDSNDDSDFEAEAKSKSKKKLLTKTESTTKLGGKEKTQSKSKLLTAKNTNKKVINNDDDLYDVE